MILQYQFENIKHFSNMLLKLKTFKVTDRKIEGIQNGARAHSSDETRLTSLETKVGILRKTS